MTGQINRTRSWVKAVAVVAAVAGPAVAHEDMVAVEIVTTTTYLEFGTCYGLCSHQVFPTGYAAFDGGKQMNNGIGELGSKPASNYINNQGSSLVDEPANSEPGNKYADTTPYVTLTMPTCAEQGATETQPPVCDDCYGTVFCYEPTDVTFITTRTYHHQPYPTVETILPTCDACQGTIIICEPDEVPHTRVHDDKGGEASAVITLPAIAAHTIHPEHATTMHTATLPRHGHDANEQVEHRTKTNDGHPHDSPSEVVDNHGQEKQASGPNHESHLEDHPNSDTTTHPHAVDGGLLPVGTDGNHGTDHKHPAGVAGLDTVEGDQNKEHDHQHPGDSVNSNGHNSLGDDGVARGGHGTDGSSVVKGGEAKSPVSGHPDANAAPGINHGPGAAAVVGSIDDTASVHEGPGRPLALNGNSDPGDDRDRDGLRDPGEVGGHGGTDSTSSKPDLSSSGGPNRTGRPGGANAPVDTITSGSSAPPGKGPVSGEASVPGNDHASGDAPSSGNSDRPVLVDGDCSPPPGQQGLQQAHYYLNMGVDVATVEPGLIAHADPIVTADGFDGLGPAPSNAKKALNLRGWLYACKSGTYTFSTPGVNGAFYGWLGDKAYSDFQGSNADQRSRPGVASRKRQAGPDHALWGPPSSGTVEVQAQSYIPFRVVCLLDGPGQCFFRITNPEGAVVFDNAEGSPDVNGQIGFVVESPVGQFPPFGKEASTSGQASANPFAMPEHVNPDNLLSLDAGLASPELRNPGIGLGLGGGLTDTNGDRVVDIGTGVTTGIDLNGDGVADISLGVNIDYHSGPSRPSRPNAGFSLDLNGDGVSDLTINDPVGLVTGVGTMIGNVINAGARNGVNTGAGSVPVASVPSQIPQASSGNLGTLLLGAAGALDKTVNGLGETLGSVIGPVGGEIIKDPSLARVLQTVGDVLNIGVEGVGNILGGLGSGIPPLPQIGAKPGDAGAAVGGSGFPSIVTQVTATLAIASESPTVSNVLEPSSVTIGIPIQSVVPSPVGSPVKSLIEALGNSAGPQYGTVGSLVGKPFPPLAASLVTSLVKSPSASASDAAGPDLGAIGSLLQSLSGSAIVTPAQSSATTSTGSAVATPAGIPEGIADNAAGPKFNLGDTLNALAQAVKGSVEGLKSTGGDPIKPTTSGTIGTQLDSQTNSEASSQAAEDQTAKGQTVKGKQPINPKLQMYEEYAAGHAQLIDGTLSALGGAVNSLINPQTADTGAPSTQQSAPEATQPTIQPSTQPGTQSSSRLLSLVGPFIGNLLGRRHLVWGMMGL
ncbi:hypothetical protein S7711_07895 [Stachybotrys chartarum IBT 7711]|uniref:GLEYA adhesin domain-containing protein n=1 Tax=Stachybotrys chartarum (strain CBS 109288 / IBT 7711) TaxID=1280523 RepID=A0A084AK18_STACB|nr:hypothetical protein S7711_07895 [Stachybotrys chartarum IBT 7711]